MSDPQTEPVASLRESATQLVDTVRNEGAELAQAAAGRATELAKSQAEMGVRQADGISRALDRAAEELNESAPMIAGYVRQAAGVIDQLGGSLRDGDPGEWLRDATAMARRHPAGLFGVAMVAGFALARFTRSSSPAGGNTGRAAAGDVEAVRRAGGRAPGWTAPTHEGAVPIPATMAANTLGGAAAYHARQGQGEGAT